MTNQKSDGYIDFSGGMDSSRGASLIGKNQYVWSTNCSLNKNRTGLSCREGYRPVELVFPNNFDKKIFLSGDFQGDGFFFKGQDAIILLSISGYIFQMIEIGRFRYEIVIVNQCSQNNPLNRNSYITGVKDAAVVNDGESAPIKIEKGSSERVTGKYAIKVGNSGVYVQNRFFYVDRNKENIIASTIRNPFSLEEAYIDNIYGFTAPEDNDYITAIGKIATLRRDVSGGNLAFSTFNNTYSVDVRGPRSAWGQLAKSGVGHVENSIPNIGAISPFSFESINSNLYFRNIGLGLVSLKRSQSEFQNLDSYTSQSREISDFFDRDSEIFLSQCRTKAYKGKLLTTINPFQKNNSVLWKGLISYYPSFLSSSQEGVLPSFFETVYTGLNIHSILPIKYPDDKEDMFMFCVSPDGENCIYVLDDSIDYDINFKGEKQEIERKILTREFDFQSPFLIKKGDKQSYSITELNRDCSVTILSRNGGEGNFSEVYNTVHRVGTLVKDGKFKPLPVKKQQRNNVGFPSFNSKDGASFFTQQDLIKILGSGNFRRLIKTAELQNPDNTVKKEEKESFNKIYNEEKVFTYTL